MRPHPIHPMLVHVPIACWSLMVFCDVFAIVLDNDFFWRAAALTTVVGVAVGALAAMAGAVDLPRARARAPKLALTHASLMSGAWLLATISLIGRLNADYQAVLPPPWWAVSAGVAAFLFMIVGAWCGGEMVYGHGIGVREQALVKGRPKS